MLANEKAFVLAALARKQRLDTHAPGILVRTVDPELLQSLDKQIVAKCEAAAAAHKVKFEREWIQRSEAGGTPEQLADRRAHPVVQTAVDVLQYLGTKLPAGREAIATGSTDANAGVTPRSTIIAHHSKAWPGEARHSMAKKRHSRRALKRTSTRLFVAGCLALGRQVSSARRKLSRASGSTAQ